jgi:hypothetical protein
MTGSNSVSGEALVAAFIRWTAEGRVREAASARTAQRIREQTQSSSATWHGLLVEVAERGEPVTMQVGSRRVSCRIAGVGPDFCVAEYDAAPAALIALKAVSSLWPAGDRRSVPLGDRQPALRLSFAAGLAAIADERLPVSLSTADAVITGELLAVGEDLATVRGAPPSRRLAHVPLEAVAICGLR